MVKRVFRIAVVIPKYGLVGGAEHFTAELTERLSRDPRFEFHVFANRWIAHSDRITFHKVPIITFPKFLTTPSFAFFADRRIRAAGIDLIHAHDRIFRADLFTMHGVPHRYWIREVRRKRPSLFDRATARVEDALVRDPRCRLFLPVSGLARDIFLREYPVTPERVRVIHPGIDPGRYEEMDRPSCREQIAMQFGFAPGEKIILFVSMNFELKGLDILTKALAMLRKGHRRLPFRLLVVGKGRHPEVQGTGNIAGDRRAGRLRRRPSRRERLQDDLSGLRSLRDALPVRHLRDGRPRGDGRLAAGPRQRPRGGQRPHPGRGERLRRPGHVPARRRSPKSSA